MSVAFSSDDSEAISRKIDICDNARERDGSISLEDMYEIQKCTEWIKKNKYLKVALQFPDDMLCDSTAVTLKLNELIDGQLFVLGDTSYGSCCVDEIAAEHIAADAIIHFGHACLSPTKRLPVLYVFGKQMFDIQNAAKAFKEMFPDPESCILIIYETMFSYAIEPFSSNLTEYKNLVISLLEIPGEDKNKIPQNETSKTVTKCHRNIILPEGHCVDDYSVFYIGSRAVTRTNFMLSLKNCHFYSYNPSLKLVLKETLDVNKHLRRRYYYIEKAKDANIIGILVGTLGVADYLTVINHLKELIRQAGKKSYTLAVGKVNNAKLANFPEIEVFVNVACIESTLIESRDFYQSIITPFELELALNAARHWTGDYVADFSEILPGAASYVPLKKIQDERSDVSLITGKIRLAELSADETTENSSETCLVTRSEMTISSMHSGGAGEYLSQRSWKGLEQHLGETSVADIEQGQKGIASIYEDENVGL